MYGLCKPSPTFHIHTQVTESLNEIFKPEKRVLDTTATIELNADPFPYELVFNWVHSINCLINHISIVVKQMPCTLGERLSDHRDQYKSSICLSSPM